MRIRTDDVRDRRYKRLCEATGEKTKAKALDVAADYYIRMAGGRGVPTGTVEKVLAAAAEQGSLTLDELAELLDTDELPVDGETRCKWAVGRDVTEADFSEPAINRSTS